MTAPTVYRTAAALLVVLLTAAAVPAQDPQEPGVTLLKNGNVLEGTVKQEGGTVTISNGAGGVVQLPASDVLCWGKDRQALYRYRADHRSGSGVDDYLAEAQWCLRQGLLSTAAQELRAAYRVHPRDPRLPVMERRLRQAADAQQKAASQSASTDDEASSDDAAPDPPAPSAPDTATDTATDTEQPIPRHLVNQYVTRVQPMLIVGCGQAACHGGSSAAAWQLTHLGSPVALSTRLTGNNLKATLRWVDLEQPEISPLLVRATSPHGGLSDPPVGSHDVDAVAELRRWITALAMRSGSSQTAVTDSASSNAQMELATSHASGHGTGGSTAAPRPMRLPPVVDPFDPDVFNRMYHPQWLGSTIPLGESDAVAVERAR